jgi:hypothetical protein
MVGAIDIIGQHEQLAGGGYQCRCVASGCLAEYELVGGQCLERCPEYFCRAENDAICVLCDFDSCCDEPQNPGCTPPLCEECAIAVDGTDLRLIERCIEIPARNGCLDCHDRIEEVHPWFGGPQLTCAGCHGGDPEQDQRELAHVPLPAEWQAGSPALGRPNARYYYNYLTLAGVERFTGGLEWLRFRDPGDLRIADLTCGRSGCHEQKVANVRRSLMATAAGVIDGARAAAGLPRAVVRGNGGIYKFDATVGMTGGLAELEAVRHDPNQIGSMPRIAAFAPRDRGALASYGEIDLLEDVYDKACGGCHLYSAGRNDRAGDFRGSGCTACHMDYDVYGRSQSSDLRISKNEPTYPVAFERIAGFDPRDPGGAGWLGPERPHPKRHLMDTPTSSRRCGTCHSGSNHTEWQLRGMQIDPNRTATRTLSLDRVRFTGEVDNDANRFARLRGLAQNQILSFVDWDDDGRNDIPADVHWLAGLECVDCHTSAEMHNELPGREGALWSRQDQATEVECAHCHGTLEARVLPSQLDPSNPIERLIACLAEGESIPGYTEPPICWASSPGRLPPGIYLVDRSNGDPHFVSQVRDSIASVEGSIFHGRVNASPDDGVGPCIGGDPAKCFRDQEAESGAVTPGFSHLDGLECTACHAAWSNACFGCHVTIDDTGGARDFSPSTGEYTLGRIAQAELTFISPIDVQLGIDSEGRVAPFTGAGGLRLRHIESDGLDWFGRRSIVAGDPSLRYGVYRHRTGYGLRPYDQEGAGLLPTTDGPVFEQRAEMSVNAAFGFNPMTPHSVQRTHARIDCTACHQREERFGTAPQGFGGISKYLETLDGLEIVREETAQRVAVDWSAGFRLDPTNDPEGATIEAQLDRVASGTGFPYASTNHPLRALLDERHRRDFPTIVPSAGPLGPNLLLLMSDIVVLPRGVN